MEGTVEYDINPLEELVSRIGLSRFDLAQMLDATPGIVDAWMTGLMTPGVRSRQRLDELVTVLDALFAAMTPRAARDWLTTPSPALDYYIPVDLMRRGDLYPVLRVIEVMPPAIRLDRRPSVLID